ncbi:beta-L-arabinofuranosidase domain-containing protein [Neolewinella sp.]|uniref:beta-L-arabinofuranosidase domain-containing protein n=1 Tax=Neolewinella sp. TaxID=2993543 RepID=UPI003B5203FC
MRQFILLLVVCLPCWLGAQSSTDRNQHYITNQPPLVATPYTALPLGAIKPHGWLRRMLELQRDGMTGHLDSMYSLVIGPTNGWLGGGGDGWERGPYWLDGLTPLAYLLDDEELKAKVQPWIEWSISNQRDDGYFGPEPLAEGYERIPGTQQEPRRDWWPRMVMLKVLQQYYLATEDERVIDLMTDYFRYQQQELQNTELGHYSFWANRRGADNLAVVYWLYNITGNDFLLELGETLHAQTFDWTTVFTDGRIAVTNPLPNLHCVNIAQGLKAPVVYWQNHAERDDHRNAPKAGLDVLRDVHGFVNGMYGADERLHGNDPTQGSEFCTAAEMMFSLETMLPITGDMYYGDYLEKVTFNVVPTQHSDDWMRKQYFQQVNQIDVMGGEYNFFDNDDQRLVYGVETGYTCCTTNMHQSYPKYIQNLWYATADNGLAALVYGASEVTARVADGQEVTFTETTDYPFEETIRFELTEGEAANFPLHLRIPEWATDTWTVSVNGEAQRVEATDRVVVLDRNWTVGDRVELQLPMTVRTSRWFQQSVGVERGPLVYALKLSENWTERNTERWPHSWYEVTTDEPWNYGIPWSEVEQKNFVVEVADGPVSDMPWNLENAPLRIRVKAARVEEWQAYDHRTGPLPAHPRMARDELTTEQITLIPYGCTTLRIAQFPVIDVR